MLALRVSLEHVGVDGSVDLDSELFFGAVEVDNEARYGLLSSKLSTLQPPVAKRVPEQLLTDRR